MTKSISDIAQASNRRPEPDAFREARVKAAKHAISEGRFQIDAQAIADRMLEAARALVRDRQKEH